MTAKNTNQQFSELTCLVVALIVQIGTARAQGVAGANDRVEFDANITSPSPEFVLSGSSTTCISSVSPFITVSCSQSFARRNTIGGVPADLAKVFQLRHGTFGAFNLAARIYKKHNVRIGFASTVYRSVAAPTQFLLIARYGDVFAPGTVAVANARWTRAKAGYRWDVLAEPRGRVGVTADFNYNKIGANARLRDFPRGSTLNYRRKVIIPTFGAIGQVALTKYLSAGADITLLRWDRWRSDGFRDVDVFGVVNIARSIGARIGYRVTSLNYAITDNPEGASTIYDEKGHLKTKGPYVGAVVRF